MTLLLCVIFTVHRLGEERDDCNQKLEVARKDYSELQKVRALVADFQAEFYFGRRSSCLSTLGFPLKYLGLIKTWGVSKKLDAPLQWTMAEAYDEAGGVLCERFGEVRGGVSFRSTVGTAGVSPGQSTQRDCPGLESPDSNLRLRTCFFGNSVLESGQAKISQVHEIATCNCRNHFPTPYQKCINMALMIYGAASATKNALRAVWKGGALG